MVPSPKFVNMAMRALTVDMRQPRKALQLYEQCSKQGGTPPSVQVATMVAQALMPPRPATAVAGDNDRAARLGSTIAKLTEVRATLHGVARVDTWFFNELMRCYLANGLLAEAEDIFYRTLKAGGTSAKEMAARPAAPDAKSWSIMING